MTEVNTSMYYVFTGVASPPPTASLPPLQLFADEIIAILMTTFSQKLSLIQLTAQYNNCFRPNQPQVTMEQLLDALKKLPNFKVNTCTLYMYMFSYNCVIRQETKNTMHTCTMYQYASVFLPAYFKLARVAT